MNTPSTHTNDLSHTTGASRLPGRSGRPLNVGEAERWASALGGGLLTLYGLKRRSLGGLLLGALGSALLYRGTTGHCPVFQQLGLNTAAPGKRASAVHIEEAVLVNKPREELYAFWRDVENLPRFMRHLTSVQQTGDNRSHWKAEAPKGLGIVEWDAEITDEEPGEQISWRSLPGADVQNAGTVRFEDAPAGRGTTVRVTIDYRPPAGEVGGAVASLLNPAFSQLVREDVRRFKHLMEAGEIPTIEGQPKGP